MKNILKYLLTGLVVVSMISCQDLDQVPISNLSEEGFYSNDEEMNIGVIGAYNGLQDAIDFEWSFTEVPSDNARIYSASTTSSTNIRVLDADLFNLNAANANIETYWNAVYHGISRCNVILEESHLNNVKDEDLRSQFEGEARFLRAYYYFNLVRLFGPVFLVTEPIDAVDALKYKRAPVDDVYAQIKEDLLKAIDMLPTSYAEEELGRATTYAAQGLYAKVLLTRGDVSGADEVLGNLLSDYGTDNLDAYVDVFDYTKETQIKENLFAIRFQSKSRYGDDNELLGSPFGNYFGPKNSGSAVINGDGDGFNHPTTEIINLYTDGDVRKDVNLQEGFDAYGFHFGLPENNYVSKYLSPVTEEGDGDSDWPVLRLADCILMYAETRNELSGPAAGLEYLNKVRARAGINEFVASDFVSQDAFLDTLKKERRLELAFENQRWFDLLRWGDAIEVINKHIVTKYDSIPSELFYLEYDYLISPIEEWQLLIPIPQSVRDINPEIEQNKGYS